MSTEMCAKLDIIIELLNDLPDKMQKALDDDKEWNELKRLAIETGDISIIKNWKNKRLENK